MELQVCREQTQQPGTQREGLEKRKNKQTVKHSDALDIFMMLKFSKSYLP